MSTYPPSRIALVTGGAGFIGSRVARTLLNQGWTVRVIDNLSGGKRERLPADDNRFSFREGDIRSREQLREAAAGVDTVFHLAALVSVVESIQKPALAEELNVEGTENVLNSAHAAGALRVVCSSTCAIYGNTTVSPIGESTEPEPLSPYAATKLAAEKIVRAWHGRNGMQAVSLRYFNVYGAGQSPDSDYAAVVPIFSSLAQRGQSPIINGDGEQSRDFIHVSDVARANLIAATVALRADDPNCFNIGTGRATSINLLWQTIARLTACAAAPLHGPSRAGDVRHSLGDVRLAAERLNFHATTSLEDGLAETLGLRTRGNASDLKASPSDTSLSS